MFIPILGKSQDVLPLPTIGEDIDLGLSVRWASHNVGATNPEEAGGYYGWGEIETKNSYNWATYSLWTDTNSDGRVNAGELTVPNEISGTVYDVAYMKMGTMWRMPTNDDWNELISKCNWYWTTYKGIKGSLVVGPNGNAIFLPAVGYHFAGCNAYSGGENITGNGSSGIYWSATVHLGQTCSTADRDGYFVSCSNAKPSLINNGHFHSGHVVRAVTSEPLEKPEKLVLHPGEDIMLKVEGYANNPTDLQLYATSEKGYRVSCSFESTNTEVVQVDDKGLLTPIALGEADIIVTSKLYPELIATCHITICHADGWDTMLANGNYYLMNVATGMFLNGAYNWGTKASLTPNGQLMTTTFVNGRYALDSHIDNGGSNHYLGSGNNTFLDAAYTLHEFIAQEDGTYAIKNELFLVAEADGKVNFSATAINDYAKWKFITRTEYINILKTATDSNPIDATTLIGDPNFSRNNLYFDNWLGDKPRKGGSSENMNVEKWNVQTFDTYQEITDLPNGLYTLFVQGFYRGNTSTVASQHANGTEELNAYFYANEVSLPLKSVADEFSVSQYGKMPNTQTEASQAFGLGVYDNSLDVVVTDGFLRIGVKKEKYIAADWVIWDNFRLIYKGTYNANAADTHDYKMYIDDQEVKQGGVTNVPVLLDNTEPIVAFECYVELSNGLSIAVDEYEDYAFILSERADRTTTITSSDKDGKVFVIGYSNKNNAFAGNTGTLFYIPIKVADNLDAGTVLPIRLSNILLTKKSDDKFHEISVPDAEASLMVKPNYMTGDVNGDGLFTAVDIALTVEFVLGRTPSNGIKEAADANSDGQFTAVDIAIVVAHVLDGK